MSSSKTNKKILIVRSAFIGDYVITLPFINYLLKYEGISRKNIHTLIINNQNFNPLKLLFKSDDNLLINSMVFDSKNFIKSYFKIKRKKYDKIYYLPFYSESKLSLLKKFLLLKSMFGVTVSIDGLKFHSNDFCNQYVYYFKVLGIDIKKLNISYDFKKVLNINTDEIAAIRNKFSKKKMRIVFYINSKLKEKKWHSENFFQAYKYLKKYYNPNIFLIGSELDNHYNQRFLKKYELSDVTNLSGKLNLRELIIFLENSNLIVTNDGAPIHLAAITKCKILGIYSYFNELKSASQIRTWDPIISKSYITVRKNTGLEDLSFNEIKHFIDELINSKFLKKSILIN